MKIVFVTGTNTGVGKTVVTAAIAACAAAAGQRVAVVKPVQTGVRPDEPGDLAEVTRLSGVTDVHEYARFDEPLAPGTAARRAGTSGPSIHDLAARIGDLADRDMVLVEGAGGMFVELNAAGQTLADLAQCFTAVNVLLVAQAGLGTLNAVATTRRAYELDYDGELAGVIIGDWPESPGLAERCNLVDLEHHAHAPLVGVVPAGVGALDRERFSVLAASWLHPALGGSFDQANFLGRNVAPSTV